MRFWVLFFAAATLHAQSFVYSNDGQGANTVSGFTVDATGKLTTITGSPFATRGNAGNVRLATDFTANRIVAAPAGNHLFASNDSDGSISAFSIDPKTGILTLVSGSPFQGLGVCNAGYSLAVSADAKTLVAATLCGPQLQAYSISSAGALSPLGSGKMTGCKSSPGAAGSLKFTSDSSYVAAADPNCSAIEVFSLTGTGALQAVAGSPFSLSASANPANSVEINCANTVLYAAGSPLSSGKSTVDAFSMSKGVLTHLPGAPYFGGVIASGYGAGQPVDLQSATLTPNDQYLVISGWDSSQFSVFQTGPGGSLTAVKGSPFGFGDLSPAQVIPSADGKFIFFAEDTDDPSVLSGVGVLAIDGNGALTQVAGSPLRNPKASYAGGNNAVAAFPPKVCQAAGPAVSVSPNPINLSTTVNGTVSQTVTITNTGSATLNIQSLQVAGNFSSDITGCFGVAVQPGNSCQIRVIYNPTTTTAVTGSLTIKDDAPDSPQVIPINGSASAGAVLSANPPSLSFAALVGQSGISQNITLTNTGGQSLIIADLKVRDISSGFNLDLTSCLAKTLQPGQSCTLPVIFVPGTTAGTSNTVINVSNTGTPNPLVISLSGTTATSLGAGISLSPATINFNDSYETVLGTSSAKRKITVTSTGTAPLQLISSSIDDTTHYDWFDSNCKATSPLAPGATCTLLVEFHPTSLGPAPVGTLSVLSNAPVIASVAISGTAINKSQCKDQDGDGLCDDWELNGLTARVNGADVFVDLPTMGAKVDHKDVFVQVDYMSVTTGSSPHSHQFTPAVMAPAIKAFLNAPLVSNPDGTGGIHLHVDCGATCVMDPVSGALWGKLSRITGIGETSYPGVDAAGKTLTDSKGKPIVDAKGNPVPVIAVSPGSNLNWTTVYSLPTNYAATGRLLAFHHVISIHRMAVSGFDSNSSGQSNNPGGNGPFSKFHAGASDLVVSLGAWPPAAQTALALGDTLMHELGHNLGLGHGGEDSDQYKPNYFSIMNYSFQQFGLIENNYSGYTDYSRYALPSIDETKLLEAPGTQGPSPSDGTVFGTLWYCPGDSTASAPGNTILNSKSNVPWDCNTKYLTPKTTLYTNGVDYTQILNIDINGDGKLTTLKSYTDWDNLQFLGGALAGNGAVTGPAPLIEVSETGPPRQSTGAAAKRGAPSAKDTTPSAFAPELSYDMIAGITPLNGVALQHPSLIPLVAGASVDVTLMLTNIGSTADTYGLTPSSVAGWLDAGSVPGSVTLQPGASTTLHVRVSAPATANVGDQQLVSVLAQSPNTPSFDSADITIAVVATPNPISLSTADLLMGTQSVGTSSQFAPITVTNTSGATLTFSSIVASGDFSQTNNCGTSLAAGSSCMIQVVFTPSSAAPQYGTVTINSNAAGDPPIVLLQGTGKAPLAPLAINAAVNAASSQSGPLAPGTLFTLYGLNLSDGPAGVTSLPLPSQLGGSSIAINGVPAGMLYADANQINAQIPFELAPGPGNILLTTSEGRTAIANLQIASVSPGLFVIPGTQHAAAQNQDLTPNLADSPAPAGGIVVVYFTGQGALDQIVATGAASPSSPPANVAAAVTATVGGQPASVVFAGMTPGAVGLAQANVTVPPTQPDGTPLPPGDYPLMLSVGGVSTGAATISVGPGR